LRSQANWMCHVAKVNAVKGDSARVASALICAVRIGDSLRFEPAVIAALVRTSLRAIVVSAMEDAMTRMDLAEGDIRLLDDELKRSRAFDDEALHRARVGERAMAAWLNDTPPAALNFVLGSLPMRMLYCASGVREWECRFFWDMANDRVGTRSLRAAARVAAIRRINQRAADAPAFFIFDWQALRFITGFPGFFMQERCEARFDATRVALAVARFRLAHAGQLPAALTQLIPDFLDAIPEDPFDGKPLKYLQLPTKGFVVYSVGPDGQDHGGITNFAQGAPSDECVRVER